VSWHDVVRAKRPVTRARPSSICETSLGASYHALHITPSWLPSRYYQHDTLEAAVRTASSMRNEGRKSGAKAAYRQLFQPVRVTRHQPAVTFL
jgi:hypothetical protein